MERPQLEQLSELLLSCFSQPVIEALGRSSRFVQRSTARLDGFTFLLLNVFESYSTFDSSLNERCDWLEEHFGLSMRKQSLDERYNTYAAAFMKSCFLHVLSRMNRNTLSGPFPFKCIQITDSTAFKIPDQLRVFYKGFQGNGGESVVKIHLNYDLLQGGIADISIGDGSDHDNSYGFGPEEKIIPEGLYLRDLGYYKFEYFRRLDEAGAYFLSRAKTNATFFSQNADGVYERIDLVEGETDGVYLGSGKKKLKVRAIVEKVPEEVALKRLKKLQTYKIKQKDKTVSPQREAMCHYNVFITNIPAEKLEASQARQVYSLRWQVEIAFKTWKSHYHIDKVRNMNIFRFECHLYAKLIAILIGHMIQNGLSGAMPEDFELSELKASKFIKKKPLADDGYSERLQSSN